MVTDEQLKAMAMTAATTEARNAIREMMRHRYPEVDGFSAPQLASMAAYKAVRDARGDVADASLCAANAARIVLREPQNW